LIDLHWWLDCAEELYRADFVGLTDSVTAPCRGSSAEELAVVGDALGCGVRQVMGHY
jgi:hypothetical protein